MKRAMITKNVCWLDVKIIALAVPLVASALFPLFRLLLSM